MHVGCWMAAGQVVSATEEANDTLRFHHRGFCSLPPACSTHVNCIALPSHWCDKCVSNCVHTYKSVCMCVLCVLYIPSLLWCQQEVKGRIYSEYRSSGISVGVLCRGVQLGRRDWCLVCLLLQRGEKGCQWYINLHQKGHNGGSRRNIDICYWLNCCHICSQVCNTNEVAT